MKRAIGFIAFAIFLSSCGSSSTPQSTQVSMSVSPSTQQTIDQGQTVHFTASLTNDTNNQGVTWSLSGSGCSGSACGTLTNATATVATYTAPASVTSALTVSVKATSVKDTTVSKSTTVVANPAPAITTTTLPGGTVGTAYSQTLAASGGTGTLSWTVTAGTLPNGLTLGASGTISGTPTASGTSNFTVKVTDSAPSPMSATQALSIPIANQVMVITTTSLSTGTVGVAYTAALQVNYATPPVTWSISSGTLPSGLTLDVNTGVISGTPSATGTSTFTVMATDSTTPTHQTATQQLSITINAVAACNSSGNESVLSGHYAFSVSGFNSTGFLAVVGAFSADGTGKITAGEADTNGALGVHSGSIDTNASSYSVGSDNRGCATIATSFGTFTTRFALGTLSSGTATEGHLIEWEAPTSSAYIAAGELLQQTTPFTAPSGTYAFSNAGVDSNSTPGRFASAGVLTASGGNFSNGEVDVNDAGTLSHFTGMTGTYGSVDANGRFTGTTTVPSGPTSNNAFYMVSSSRLLLLSTDAPGTNAIVAGEVRGQSGTFSNSSVSGNLVLYMMGLNGGGSGGTAQFGLVNANGSGSLTATIYEDDAGTWSAPSTPTCTYSVAANGRMTLSGTNCGNHSPVFYLSAANNGFMLDTDTGVGVGQVEAQTGAPFSIPSLSGTFSMGTVAVVNQGAETGVGVVTLDGSGGLSGTNDYTATSYQMPDQAFTDTITTVNSDGTVITADHPALIAGIIISGTQFVIVDNQGSTYPTISVVNK